jgi:hypothetical protein
MRDFEMRHTADPPFCSPYLQGFRSRGPKATDFSPRPQNGAISNVFATTLFLKKADLCTFARLLVR